MRWYLLPALLSATALVLIPTIAYAHGIHASDGSIHQASFWEFLKIGAEHMLAGYDHLLFVLGIVLLVKRLKYIVGYVTAFTIGHSITLLLASLAGISVNYLLIDALIGLSVAYIGFENVYGKRFREDRQKRWKLPDPKAIIYGFGLLHGLGLATRLQALGLPEEGAIKAILGFNVGVEVGQLVALLVMISGVWFLKKLMPYDKIKQLTGQGLIVVGILLFLALLLRAAR